MATTKIRKVGGSLGMILPKNLLDQMNLGEGDEVSIIPLGDGAFKVTAYNERFEEQLSHYADVAAQYRNALAHLAK
jgi:putative addiction module antidote